MSPLLSHVLLVLGVLFLQVGYALNGVIVKNALNKGLNPYSFSVYRNIAAAVAFGPFAVYFERNTRPKMKLTVFLQIMLLAQLEPVMDQILYYTGMRYTTATFAIAMCNIIPALTFFMAWMFRLEQVDIKRFHSQMKILGTLVTVGGAMVMTLVSGPPIPLRWTHANTVHVPLPNPEGHSHHDVIKGAIMITVGCVCWAGFFILQAVTLNQYYAPLSLTSLICVMGALQGGIVTLFLEKGRKDIWSVNWDAKLFATLYSGIIRSGASYYVSSLIMRVRGPFFVTAFNPLGMVIVVFLSSFTLGEQITMGRIGGALTIVIGLYMIIWGKSQDSKSRESGNNEAVMTAQETEIVDIETEMIAIAQEPEAITIAQETNIEHKDDEPDIFDFAMQEEDYINIIDLVIEGEYDTDVEEKGSDVECQYVSSTR